MVLRTAMSVLLVVACGVTLAACGGPVTGSSNCGPSYTINENGHSVSNTCAGNIPTTPVRFTITSGSHFTILIGHEESGKLDFPIPRPAGPEIRLISRSGPTITYAAVQPGKTSLVAHGTIFCDSDSGKLSSCAAATVTVRRP